MNKLEELWAGKFGDQYHGRRHRDVPGAVAFFDEALFGNMGVAPAVIEFGAGVGTNLQAIREIVPAAELSAVEINDQALGKLRTLGLSAVFSGSILDWQPAPNWDLVISKGLLIHIAPSDLPRAFSALYGSSRRSILIAEYFSAHMQPIRYRGIDNALWKGPYAYMMMDTYSDLRLVNYGFVSSRDKSMAEDDINWFLMEKTS
jgi:pseudaminic acid biosynthesis-associated methylase